MGGGALQGKRGDFVFHFKMHGQILFRLGRNHDYGWEVDILLNGAHGPHGGPGGGPPRGKTL